MFPSWLSVLSHTEPNPLNREVYVVHYFFYFSSCYLLARSCRWSCIPLADRLSRDVIFILLRVLHF